LADGTVVAFVVDGPDGGVVAGGVGTVAQRVPGPGNLSGRHGFVQSMATDPGHRGLGLGRAVFTALLDWFRAEGIGAVDLHASADGEALYRSFGFTDAKHPELRWRDPGARAATPGGADRPGPGSRGP
jgi:GNAT superfamily N-acetyltransferase